jgi:hypothetical protein
MPKPTKPSKSPKELIVEARRAEAAAVALEQDLAAARGRGAAAAELARTKGRADEARRAAAERKAEHDAGLAAWDAYQMAEEEERRAAEDARITEIQAQVWPEGRP